MQQFLKVTQQTSWQILGKIISSAASFIILALIARNYGEADTGIYTLTLAYLTIFYWISDLGLNAIVLQKISSGAKIIQWNKLLGARFIWSVVLATVSIIMLPFLPFTTPDFFQAVLLGALTIIGVAIFTSVNLIFQWKLRYDLSIIASSIGSILLVALIIWFVFTKISIPFLLAPHVISWFVVVVLALFLASKFVPKIMPIFDLGYTHSLIKNSWAVSLSLLFNLIYFRLDAFILAYFRGPFEVGIYNLPYSVFQAVLTVPIFIMNSFYPMMLVSLKANLNKFYIQIRKSFLILLGLSLLASFVVYFFSHIIIKTLVGSGFEGSVTSLQVLSFGFPAYFLSALLMWVMITLKMFKKLLFVYGIGLIFNLMVNLIFIPQYSYLAAAWITGISEYLILILQLMILWLGKADK